MSFINLPQDILATVFVNAWDNSPNSALALAATCRELKTVSIPITHRYLPINIRSPTKLADDVISLRTTSTGKNLLQYARHLKLTGRMSTIPGRMYPEMADDILYNVQEPESTKSHAQDLRTTIKAGSVFDLEEPLDPKFNSVLLGDGSLEPVREYAAAWKPLLDLLRDGFTHLLDVVWECKGQFPHGLTIILEQHQPNCRLHLRQFRFLSLRNKTTDTEELKLAQSPLLHSLSVYAAYRDSNGIDDHNEAAALRVLTTAPHLKHFRLLGARPASSPQLAQAQGTAIQQWKGFAPNPARNQRAALVSFSTTCYRLDISNEGLDKWMQYVDFSTTQTTLFAITDAVVFERLYENDMLRNLREIVLTLKRSRSDRGQYLQAAEIFFARLPLLRKLDLSGTVHRELLSIIADRHGPTLEELAIKPHANNYDMVGPPLLLDATDVELLAQKCTKLKELELTIKRTKGDNRETRCYEAIGVLRGLLRVVIHLDCCNTLPPSARSMTDVGPAEMKTALINSAIDEKLVRALWEIIAGAHTVSKVEKLSVTSYGGSSFSNSHPGDLMSIVQHISRSYTITREGNNEIKVVELTRTQREKADKQARKHEEVMGDKWGGKRRMGGDAYKAMMKLWDLGEGGADWREIWSSFPLERSSDH